MKVGKPVRRVAAGARKMPTGARRTPTLTPAMKRATGKKFPRPLKSARPW